MKPHCLGTLALWPEQPHILSLHHVPPHSPAGQSLLGEGEGWGLSPILGLWLLKKQRLKDEFRSTRMKTGFKTDRNRVLWTLLWALREKSILAQL